jgi:acylphosphatase
MAQDLQTWEVRASGRVQGVYYRAYTRDAAQRLGITGWVCNERDGSVLALIQHPKADVLSELTRLMREGPPAARVDELNVSPHKTEQRFAFFEIRYGSPWRER